MQITAITQQKKIIENVNLFLDGAFWCSLSKNQMIEFGLHKDKEITESEKVLIEKASSENKNIIKLQKFLQLRPRSVLETKQHLMYKKRLSEEEAQNLIHKLLEKKYLDDRNFAEWYTRTRLENGTHGNNKIKAELISKGISESLIKETFQIFTDDPEYKKLKEEKMNKYIEKLWPKIKGKSEYEKKMKLRMKLRAKGY
jgi:regulatory protein